MNLHIETLITHFGDACYAWDVVNEALSDSPTAANPWRADIWYNVIGPDYVQIAYQTAAATVAANNLTVKLYYNDYSIEFAGAKTNAAYALVKNLTAAGILIDGVGLQGHFIIGQTPSASSFNTVMQGFTNLINTAGNNITVAVTELDVRGTLPISDAQQIQQFNDYRNAVGGCVLNGLCVGVTLWDFDDTYSWVPSTFKGQGWATPWYLNGSVLTRKLAYDGIIDAFTGATTL